MAFDSRLLSGIQVLVAAVEALPATERAGLSLTLEKLVRAMAPRSKRPVMFFEEPARSTSAGKVPRA